MSRIVSLQSIKAHESGSQHAFSTQNLVCSGHTAIDDCMFYRKALWHIRKNMGFGVLAQHLPLYDLR